MAIPGKMEIQGAVNSCSLAADSMPPQDGAQSIRLENTLNAAVMYLSFRSPGSGRAEPSQGR